MKTLADKVRSSNGAVRLSPVSLMPSYNPPCTNRQEIRQVLRSPKIQLKLVVGASNDVFEQEADRVADHVMGVMEPFEQQFTPSSLDNRNESVQPVSLSCNDDGVIKEKESQSQEAASKDLSEIPPIIHEVLRSHGEPLDANTRAFFEPRFGHDFSQVRVHTDAKAAESARAVNALAYTVGQDVAFDTGRCSPHMPEGRRLLAHELTHVIQQTATGNNTHRAPADIIHRLSRWVLQRRDATFVSTVGEQGYLNNAVSFHNAWGYPNVRRARSLEEIINWVSANIQGSLSRLRIVTHANDASIITPVFRSYRRPTNLETIEEVSGGLMPILSRSRGHVTNEDLVDRVFTSLRANPANMEALQRLGADRRGPSAGSSLHGFVWWLLDRHLVQNIPVQVRGGQFPNRRSIALLPIRLYGVVAPDKPNRAKYYTRSEIAALLLDTGIVGKCGPMTIEGTEFAVVPPRVRRVQIPLAARLNALLSPPPPMLEDLVAMMYSAHSAL